MKKSIIEDNLKDSQIFTHQEQPENKFYTINDMIDDNSHLTYDKYPVEAEYFEMIENDFLLKNDEYPQESDYYNVIKINSPPIFDDYPPESE